MPTTDLRHYGASIAAQLRVMEDLDSVFAIDPAAVTYGQPFRTECDRVDESDAISLLRGGRLICASVQDNDQEIWMVSKGGDIFRITGSEDPKYHIAEPTYAQEFLSGFADDDAISNMRRIGLFKTPASKLGM